MMKDEPAAVNDVSGTQAKPPILDAAVQSKNSVLCISTALIAGGLNTGFAVGYEASEGSITLDNSLGSSHPQLKCKLVLGLDA